MPFAGAHAPGFAHPGSRASRVARGSRRSVRPSRTVARSAAAARGSRGEPRERISPPAMPKGKKKTKKKEESVGDLDDVVAAAQSGTSLSGIVDDARVKALVKAAAKGRAKDVEALYIVATRLNRDSEARFADGDETPRLPPRRAAPPRCTRSARSRSVMTPAAAALKLAKSSLTRDGKILRWGGTVAPPTRGM